MSAFGRRGWLIPVMLVAALTLQITALCVPFIEMSMFIKGTTIYGLLTSIHLMWAGGLYVIAILIISFSVVFPFMKLAGLTLAWMVLPPGTLRTDLIRILGMLGKWSMMDPFCVILVVALASDQWAVGADTQVGIYCFLCAVVLSMTLSMMMMHCDRKMNPSPIATSAAPFRIAQKVGWESSIVPIALVISMVALYFALSLPFLEIDQFLLKSNSFGIFQLCIALWTNHHHALALLAWTGLLIVPVTTILFEWWFWLSRANPARHIAHRRFVDTLYEWSMLDVFSLSLVLFLLEGNRFIKTEVHKGLWFIVIAVIISQVSRRIARSTAQKCFRRRLD
ncbi:MAG: hypothetical protein RL692_271 [Planctomycetota bacterium]